MTRRQIRAQRKASRTLDWMAAFAETEVDEPEDDEPDDEHHTRPQDAANDSHHHQPQPRNA